MNYKIKTRLVNKKDINAVKIVLSDWLSKKEVIYYTQSIKDIISTSLLKPKYDGHYYVAIANQKIIGVAGFRMPLPKLLKFASTKNPAELCMLYVAAKHRGGKGVGTALLNHVINQAKKRKYKELIVRSAKKFKKTGWGFYDHMGFNRVGELLPPDSKTISQVWSKKI
ncbi:MAG: GNAT family N-acetyltransferase [Candidatus Komeilibacteria bacterium]|nr:GNAT family N-acetyltransferase [Candidatus Komeilibacteria bacterium]